MSEIHTTIHSGGVALEGMFSRGNRADGVVLCHPHPLYGGSMDNNVVLALQGVFDSLGWGTLRFNFRGVGQSSGQFDEGKGEAQDVVSAASHLFSLGFRRIHLAGYSFGAWVGLRAVREGLKPDSVVLASPPLDFISFGDLTPPAVPCLITLGDEDSFCSVESLKSWLSGVKEEGVGPQVRVLPRCDHFYWGAEEGLSRAVVEFIHDSFEGSGS